MDPSSSGAAPVQNIVDRMRAHLLTALRSRDSAAVAALRTTLAAISNAEAPAIDTAPRDVSGRLVDHERLVLTEDDVRRIVSDELAERDHAAREYLEFGRVADAERVRREASVLREYTS